MNVRNPHSILFVLLCAISICCAQQNFKYRVLNTADGLSQNSIYALAQDSVGFIWIGTKDGLNRYDGYNFEIFKKNPFDSLSLSDNWIQSLLVDSKNQLWIGTFAGGLQRLENNRTIKKIQVSDPEQTDASNRILAIYEDSRGQIWVGTTNGLFRVNHLDQLEAIELPLQISVTTIIEHMNSLWLGTWGAGVFVLNNSSKEIEQFSTETNSTFPGNYIRSIIKDQSAEIWLIAYGAGLSKLTDQKRFINFQSKPSLSDFADKTNPNSFNQHLVWSIAEIDAQNFLLGYSDGSVLNFNRENSQFTFISSLQTDATDERISQIHIDKSGLIWLAGTENGVRIYSPRIEQFNHISTRNSAIISDQIIASFIENDQSIWLGTASMGLIKFSPDGDKIKQFRHNNRSARSLTNDRVETIFIDHKNNLWAGTFNGLNKINSNRDQIQQFTFNARQTNGIIHPHITSLLEDAKGLIWIATFGGGLSSFDPETEQFTTVNTIGSQKISSLFINQLYFDSHQRLWIATVDAGLICIDENNTFRFFKNNPGESTSISHNNVQSIIEDANGKIWIGTYGGGLNLLDETGKFRHFTQENGFFSNSIVSMQIDLKNQIWIASNSGLVRFNANSYEYTIFDVNNGLQGNQFNKSSSFNPEFNLLLFAGNNGINLFQPDDITGTSFAAPILITASQDITQLAETNIDGVTGFYLPFDKNYISFQFTLLDYTSPNKNLYSYRMLNLDDDWSVPSKERFVNYSNLESGTYTFEFKGSNSEGLWSNVRQIQIIVDLPFYSKIPFQLAIFVLLIVIVLIAYRARLSKLAEIEKTRYRIARDLHDEIGGTLTGIGILAETLNTGSDVRKQKSLLKSIKENVTSAQETMSDIIWSISPKNDSWPDLIKRMQDFASDTLEHQSIAYTINTNEFDMETDLKMEKRQHLWRIFKEIITNIAKHSKCKNAQIKLYNQDERIFLEVSDDGIGYTIGDTANGNGLLNIRARADLLKAVILHDSKLNGGCFWQISFKR